MVTSTPGNYESLIAAGAQVVVRDEEWLVTQVQQTPADGLLVRCLATSTLENPAIGSVPLGLQLADGQGDTELPSIDNFILSAGSRAHRLMLCHLPYNYYAPRGSGP